MKRFLVLVFLFAPIALMAQTIVKYNIKCVIRTSGNAKYGYFVRTTDLFKIIPIVNGEFQLKDTITLGDDLYKPIFFVFKR